MSDEDIERRLAAALRAEAERVTPAGDGLARIRARTERPVGLFSRFGRPAFAGAALALTLIGATVVGVNLTDDDPGTLIVDGARQPVITVPRTTPAPKINPTPEPTVAPDLGEGGQDFPVDTELTPVPSNAPQNTTLAPPVTPEEQRAMSDGGIPVDNGGNYMAIIAPLSGRTYDSPLTLAGRARVFEGAVTIDVSQNGRVLQTAYDMATAGAPEVGDWQATFVLAPGNYRIDAYALSPEDGTTRLASDSIWITIAAPPAPATPGGTPPPDTEPAATPTATAAPALRP
ncbi:MAG: Gmad2 immunoglobulin-like domain-containing protein [Sporichthyaceae bacterium]